MAVKGPVQLRDPGGSVGGEIIWELDLHNNVFLLYLHYCAFWAKAMVFGTRIVEASADTEVFGS